MAFVELLLEVCFLPSLILDLNSVDDRLTHTLWVSLDHTRLKAMGQEIHLHLIVINLLFEHR